MENWWDFFMGTGTFFLVKEVVFKGHGNKNRTKPLSKTCREFFFKVSFGCLDVVWNRVA